MAVTILNYYQFNFFLKVTFVHSLYCTIFFNVSLLSDLIFIISSSYIVWASVDAHFLGQMFSLIFTFILFNYYWYLRPHSSFTSSHKLSLVLFWHNHLNMFSNSTVGLWSVSLFSILFINFQTYSDILIIILVAISHWMYGKRTYIEILIFAIFLVILLFTKKLLAIIVNLLSMLFCNYWVIFLKLY